MNDPNKFPEMRWTPERIARFWDWQSQYPEVYFTFQFGREIADSLGLYLSDRKKILDYGCGVGYLLPHLCRYSSEVYGADPSVDSIALTNERIGGTAGFKGAFLISELRGRQDKFDAIVVIEVIEHLFDGDLDAVLADVRELLAPGGVAVFTTPNNENLAKSIVLNPTTGEVYHRWQHVRSWNAGLLAGKLNSSGFRVVQTIETNMAIARPNTAMKLLKRAVKRLLFGPPGTPHLVCVVERG